MFILTSAQLVVGSVAVEIVALAELAVVDLGRILSLLAFAGAADTVAVVAADVCAIVFSALGVQVLGLPLVPAALAQTADASLVAPVAEEGFALLLGNIQQNNISLMQSSSNSGPQKQKQIKASLISHLIVFYCKHGYYCQQLFSLIFIYILCILFFSFK